ncbi:MAG: type II toxin-antitoxin system RelB/DinJ family antitoxin [Cyanobacteriota bacterium]
MMAQADTYVRARIDRDTKQRASDALAAMGLSVSDAIRLLMVRIADEHKLPFAIQVPNLETIDAISELESGQGQKVANVQALIAELHAND